MARSSDSDANGALELFLDTLTNTFGGIVFIFLMVCLQLNISRAATPARQNARERLEYLQTADKLEGAQAEVARAERDLAELGDKFRALVSERQDDKFDEFVRLQEETRGLKSRWSGYTATSNEQAIRSLQEQLKKQQEHNEELRKKALSLKRDVESPSRQARRERIPRVREVLKDSIVLILAQKKLFFVHKYTLSGEAGQVDIEQIQTEDAGGGLVRICPLPSGGFPVDGTSRFSEYWNTKVTRRFNKDRHAIIVAVLGDSYEEADVLKEKLMEDGFDYNMLPEADDKCVVMTKRGGGPTLVQ